MANTHETLTSLFTDTADAIRTKTGETEAIVADEFPDKIRSIAMQTVIDCSNLSEPIVIFDSGTTDERFGYDYGDGTIGSINGNDWNAFALNGDSNISFSVSAKNSANSWCEFKPVTLKNVTANTTLRFHVVSAVQTWGRYGASSTWPVFGVADSSGAYGQRVTRKNYSVVAATAATDVDVDVPLGSFVGRTLEDLVVTVGIYGSSTSKVTSSLVVSKIELLNV